MRSRFLDLGIIAALLSVTACGSDSKPTDKSNSGAEADDDSDDTKDDDGDDDTSTIDAGPAKVDSGSGRIDAGGSKLDAGLRPKPDATTDAAGDAGSSDSATGGEKGAFETCQAALKAPCSYDEKETACASLTTPEIPLSAGGAWGKKEVQGGPYGAFVEWNEGKAFENPTSPLEGLCTKEFVALAFGEPDAVNEDVVNLRGQELSLYTIFRPACMRDGEKYPVITWGNGTCGQTGGYATLLANLASHGFVVFASNSRYTDGGNKEMLKALDFAKAVNDDKSSPLYQRLDLDKIGAAGHSQGASATTHAATDPRIKAMILWNGGRGEAPAKPFLAISGERDINNPTAAALSSFTNGATQPGAWLFLHKVLMTGGSATGHLTLMEQPERVTELNVAWWKYMLNGDQEAKKMFVGTDCGLCNKKDEFEYGAHNLQ